MLLVVQSRFPGVGCTGVGGAGAGVGCGVGCGAVVGAGVGGEGAGVGCHVVGGLVGAAVEGEGDAEQNEHPEQKNASQSEDVHQG